MTWFQSSPVKICNKSAHTLWTEHWCLLYTHTQKTKSVKESGFEMMIPKGKIYRKKVLKRIVQCDGSLIELQRFSHCRNEIGHERLITGFCWPFSTPKRKSHRQSEDSSKILENSPKTPMIMVYDTYLKYCEQCCSDWVEVWCWCPIWEIKESTKELHSQ